MPDSRARRLPTSVPVPVDPEFVDTFLQHGWARVERIWGKRRVQTWVGLLGRAKLEQMRREQRSGRVQ
jgi:hypothetical protein